MIEVCEVLNLFLNYFLLSHTLYFPKRISDLFKQHFSLFTFWLNLLLENFPLHKWLLNKFWLFRKAFEGIESPNCSKV